MPDETSDATASPLADDAVLPDAAAVIRPGNANVESGPDPEWSGPEAAATHEAVIPEASGPATFQEAAAPEVPAPAAFREAAAPEVPAPVALQEAAAPSIVADAGAPIWQASAPRPDVAAVAATPWPTDEPSDAAAGHGAGDADAAVFSSAPTSADWRQLADEVRRLSTQIAHGRA